MIEQPIIMTVFKLLLLILFFEYQYSSVHYYCSAMQYNSQEMHHNKLLAKIKKTWNCLFYFTITDSIKAGKTVSVGRCFFGLWIFRGQMKVNLSQNQLNYFDSLT